MCIGTELYLMFLQPVWLIKIFDDTLQKTLASENAYKYASSSVQFLVALRTLIAWFRKATSVVIPLS